MSVNRCYWGNNGEYKCKVAHTCIRKCMRLLGQAVIICPTKAQPQRCGVAKLKGLLEVASCQVNAVRGQPLMSSKTQRLFFMRPRKEKQKSGRKVNLLIALNTMFVIFGLASGFTGTIAWFMTSKQLDTSAGQFAIANCGDDCELFSIELVKFDYLKTTYNPGQRDEFTVIDYITPETGSVNLRSGHQSPS